MASDDSESYSDTLSTTSSEDSPDSGSMNSSQTSEDMEDAIALMEVDAAIKDMPDLVDFYFKVFDDDSDDDGSEDHESEESDDEDESGNEVDDEEVWVDEELRSSFGPGYAKWVRQSIKRMYSTRYEELAMSPSHVPRPKCPIPLKCSKTRGLIFFAKSCASRRTHLTGSVRR